MNQARHTGFAKLTQKDVSAAAARHEMLYSGRMGGARAVFAFCDLSGLDLRGRNFHPLAILPWNAKRKRNHTPICAWFSTSRGQTELQFLIGDCPPATRRPQQGTRR